MKVFTPKAHQAIYIIAIGLLLIGLPVSKFLMSIAQITLIVNWLLEGRLKDKFHQFLHNKPALLVSSVFIINLLGLAYSNNIAYGLADLRIKLPLLLLPLIFSTLPPLSKYTFQLLLQLFIATLVVSSSISLLILTDTLIHRQIVDIRNASVFTSHIRFGLMLCLGFFVSVYLLLDTVSVTKKWIYGIVATWLFVFMVLIESVTGLGTLFITLFILIISKLIIRNRIVINITTFLIASLIVISSVVIASFIELKENKQQVQILEKTTRGTPYQQDLTNTDTENGNRVWLNYSEKEMEMAWNKVSDIKYGDKDLKGNAIAYTLIRFLASKGASKDADGVEQLTLKEIKAIQKGHANINYVGSFTILARINAILWEIKLYRKTGDANGHSITQRFEYWKTAFSLWKKNFLFGVGSGDTEDEMMQEYDYLNSNLFPQWRLHPHNQYLSVAIASGLIGLAWFLISLFYPVFKLKMNFNFLYISFFSIALLSFITEDTLETQAGVTFFAFFNSFFLFLQHPKKKNKYEGIGN